MCEQRKRDDKTEDDKGVEITFKVRRSKICGWNLGSQESDKGSDLLRNTWRAMEECFWSVSVERPTSWFYKGFYIRTTMVGILSRKKKKSLLEKIFLSLCLDFSFKKPLVLLLNPQIVTSLSLVSQKKQSFLPDVKWHKVNIFWRNILGSAKILSSKNVHN